MLLLYSLLDWSVKMIVLLHGRVHREQAQTLESIKACPLDQHDRIHRTIPFNYISQTRSNNTMHLVYSDTKGSAYDFYRDTVEDGTSSRTKHALMPGRFVRSRMCVCPPLDPHVLFLTLTIRHIRSIDPRLKSAFFLTYSYYH
jgi:hypothetical protein